EGARAIEIRKGRVAGKQVLEAKEIEEVERFVQVHISRAVVRLDPKRHAADVVAAETVADEEPNDCGSAQPHLMRRRCGERLLWRLPEVALADIQTRSPRNLGIVLVIPPR